MLDHIEGLEAGLRSQDDDGLRREAQNLRRRVRDAETTDAVVAETFALVREIARRTLGERHYAVQLLAGLALHRGHLVEMATGEGKTLASVAPIALDAFRGQGVHVLTYNDYLAGRDAAWMAPIYDSLGLTVGVVRSGMSGAERRRAYGCDITYGTVKEVGFDFLRDGLALAAGDVVQRSFGSALIDEADSILIDEARIPLVIAGNEAPTELDLMRIAEVVRGLRAGEDFECDEYAHNVFLTEAGVRRTERALGCDDLFAGEQLPVLTELRSALHARALLRRDVDYIVRDGQIELVDELTGRVAENRHWPDGLQAALEAKEGLALGAEGIILGSITIQHFLQRYPKLAGMTATGRPAARELAHVYNLEVVTVPPHRPCRRVDEPDVVFARREGKTGALIDEIRRVHASGRPVLVGTVSVEESEALASALDRAGVPCRTLNARNDAEEAEIVAEAGRLGAVTISTNMAGRGTDIRLGGSDESSRERVIELGGLCVLGTNRHESRRVDDQLRGRSGRQGDPGSSRFFVSLEDPLLIRFGIDRLLPPSLRNAAGDGPLTHPAIRREVERVQRIVEGQHGDIRGRLMRYALQIERQREDYRARRQAWLEGTERDALLSTRCAETWDRLTAAVGAREADEVQRRVALLTMDRCWALHLAEMQAMRDENPLLAMAGEDPLVAFFRDARASFEALQASTDDEIVATFEALPITADGVDWEAAGLRGPSSTWTYMVDDETFKANMFQMLATQPGVGLWAVIMWWPLLVAWGAVLRWRRWRASRTN